jgi:signal transduction histidine kinase
VHTVTTRWPPPERRASTYRDLELRVTTSHGGRSLVIIRDVSERHRLEAQLHLSERLASLGRIAAGVAHEVSNPLTYVYGNIELALETLDAIDARDPSATQNLPELAELRTLLSEAREGGDRIRAIIEDIGLLARSDAGGNASRIDLRDVIRSVVRMLGNALRRTAKVELEVAPVALVMGSVPRMIQVLTNLLVNALHAFPSRPIDVNQVVIRLFQRDAEVILEVNDNGTGIAPDVRARIFEPFFTTKDVGQGMGLGLSMSLGIVAAVGGRFEVDTEVGRGTTMRIILPSAPSP